MNHLWMLCIHRGLCRAMDNKIDKKKCKTCKDYDRGAKKKHGQ